MVDDLPADPADVLPTRQVHLDFHTGPWVPDVGRDFDAETFADVLAEARVNSVTLFAKCHHGHLYYRTDRPERHPSLPRHLDLLEEQVEACRRRGIRTPLYLSVQCDEYAANTHPEWVARDVEGRNVGGTPLGGGPSCWQILDMGSPYADFLAEQIEEVVTRFRPVDGVFLDMCWDQPSVSRWALDGMRRSGLDAGSASDRLAWARQVSHRYMARYNELIARCNGGHRPRVFYNSRPKLRLVEESRFLRHVEIEALPTGGWGYTYFPLNVRFARNFGLPWVGMTARFHKSWSDFGGTKPRAALLYECAQMLAHGAAGCSVGDQLHPRGAFERGAYDLIGSVYRHVEACEPFCSAATPLSEIAVLRDTAGEYHVRPGDALEGVVRLLQQTAHSFDFIHAGVNDDDIVGRFQLLIVPDGFPLDARLSDRLVRLSRRGVRVLVAGTANLEQAGAELRETLGVASVEPCRFTTVFLRYAPALVSGLEAVDHVLYEPTLRLSATAEALAVGGVVEPYFERTWEHFCGHHQTPGATLTDRFAATVASGGAAVGFDLFRQYAVHGNVHLKRCLAAVLDRLLPSPLLRAPGMPSHLELTLTRQGTRTNLHVLSFAPQRRTPPRAAPPTPRPRPRSLRPRALRPRWPGLDCHPLRVVRRLCRPAHRSRLPPDLRVV